MQLQSEQERREGLIIYSITTIFLTLNCRNNTRRVGRVINWERVGRVINGEGKLFVPFRRGKYIQKRKIYKVKG
tara:strand:+ start:318 stop:539 length:222 start_codon:yes stop_codon:yes gene_type:complete